MADEKKAPEQVRIKKGEKSGWSYVGTLPAVRARPPRGVGAPPK